MKTFRIRDILFKNEQQLITLLGNPDTSPEVLKQGTKLTFLNNTLEIVILEIIVSFFIKQNRDSVYNMKIN